MGEEKLWFAGPAGTTTRAFLDSAAKRETGTMTPDKKRRRLRNRAKQLPVLIGSQLEAEQAPLELDFTPARVNLPASRKRRVHGDYY